MERINNIPNQYWNAEQNATCTLDHYVPGDLS